MPKQVRVKKTKRTGSGNARGTDVDRRSPSGKTEHKN
jgi:hypothetical protein